MSNHIVRLAVEHPHAGLVAIEKQGSTLRLSYKDREQFIEWNVPEPLIAVGSEEGELCFTFSLANDARLKKKLYFNDGAFSFRIPDGISYFLTCEISTFPFSFFQAREGSCITFIHPAASVNLQVNIDKTVCEDAATKKYFTDYTLISGNLRKSCRLYAGDDITIGEYWLCQSPKATSWPVFLINNHAMDKQQVARLCP
ncbi:hypothetical protein [Erwinia sp. CGal63]|uniref:hypothetical protein n=1 Tax=Erwinia sp. CGal63 TaxID=2919889 RepID=UPI00300BBDD9